MPPVISYLKNPISWDQSEARDSITVYGLERIRGVSKGMGILYFWIVPESRTAGWNSQFSLVHGTPAQCSNQGPNQVTLSLDAQARFPCSGLITGTREGYVIAPAIELAAQDGKDVILMLLSSNARAHEVSVEKTTLALPGEDATLTLSTDNAELSCAGIINGHGFKAARIVLNRNPGLPVYREGFNETLCEIREPGAAGAVWKPVARNIEPCLLAFNPPTQGTFSKSSFFPPFDDLAKHLGAPEDDYSGTMTDYVVGDGVGVGYTIRLILDRGLGRHSLDESSLKVT
jgi:hypothetical protein